MQYGVAFYPDDTIRVEVVGPFRSHARAEAAAARLEWSLGDLDDDLDMVDRLPNVVRLLSEREAVELYGPEPHDSGSDRG